MSEYITHYEIWLGSQRQAKGNLSVSFTEPPSATEFDKLVRNEIASKSGVAIGSILIVGVFKL
jgi:hypothetical protein